MYRPETATAACDREAAALPAEPVQSVAAGTLQSRVAALEELLDLSRERLDARTLAETERVLEQVAQRRRLSLDHTVVALAGATGSGKSTLFNALIGAELSRTGVRRPMTGAPVACTFDPDGAGPLLDRLGVAPQHRYLLAGGPAGAVEPAGGGRVTVRAAVGQVPAPGTDRCSGAPGPDGGYGSGRLPDGRGWGPGESEGGAGGGAPAQDSACRADGGYLDGSRDHEEHGPYGGSYREPGGAGLRAVPGLVLLDLPDHDSAAVRHRRQVDRVLNLVDAVVWVVDPEKYADAALHERYLRPMAGYADVTAVVLNQADRLPGEVADQVLDDLRRLLDEDGLALCEHGESGALVLAASALTGEGVAELRAAIHQLAADRQAADRRLAADLDRAAQRLRPACVGSGTSGIADAAREEFWDRLGEAVGAEAAGQSAERQWAAAARRACGVAWPRPRRRSPGRPVAKAGPAAARPMVEEAVRAVGGAASDGLPEPWARAVREAARSCGRGLPEALEAAVARAWYGIPGPPRWWTVVGWVQRLLAVLAVLGIAWTAAVAAGVPLGPLLAPLWGPAVPAAGAPAGALLLAVGCGVVNREAARRHGRRVAERTRGAAAECGRRQVLDPVDAELLRYRQMREKYGSAGGRRAA